MSDQSIASMRSLLNQRGVLLAPLAGVSDLVFRQINREHKADLTYTEMVSAKGLSYANEKTRHLLDLAENEDIVAVQVFGHEPEVIAREAAWIEEQLQDRLAYIDINMGCPARKIVSKGDGSALMKTPELASRIVESASQAINHPVTVKFRRGYNTGDETCVEFAKRMEQAGAAACAVHGRFAMQMYSGHADWDAIHRVVDAVKIPVIGNGDITSGQDALNMLGETGCAAIMIGRAAQGNPWIFRQIADAMAGKAAVEPTNEEKFDVLRWHLYALAQLKGEAVAVREAQVMQESLFDSHPKAAVTADYAAFVKDYLNQEDEHHAQKRM